MDNIRKNFKRIGIFGYGNMGKSIFEGISQKADEKISFFVYSKSCTKDKYITVCDSVEELVQCCDIVFICVKPQNFKNLKFDVDTALTNDTIFISIMAGITIKEIEQKFKTQKIVRTMPNMPLQVQRGVVGWFIIDKTLSDVELKKVKNIINYLGIVVEVKEEDQLNAITAVSGSGPAYVFLFVDALIQSSINLGISEKDSKKIVFETIEGSLAYIRSNEQDSLPDLIQKITSSGGTTEAAFKQINAKQFYDIWKQGVQKAYERAQELSS